MGALLGALDALPLWALGLFLFGLFTLAAAVGRGLRRFGTPDEDDETGVVVSASLGLLALLLGFTVSMAVGRFEDRRIATTAEANAIGTFVYRTDLLASVYRQPLLRELDRYVDARLAVSRRYASPDAIASAKATTADAADRVWRQLMAGRTDARDDAVDQLLVEAANAMFDSATARDAAIANRLPATLITLLLFFPVASLVLIGYVSGHTRGVHLIASTELILLLTLVLLLISDLDRATRGTIFNSQQTLIDVRAQLDRALARQAAAPVPARDQQQ
jgi:hypothetical protein